MGIIRHFDLKKFKTNYGLKHFFETGSFKGEGIKHARKFDFEKIWSSEIMDEYVQLCQDRFAEDSRVKIYKGTSADIITNEVSKLDGPTLFWLDAHFPGADGGLREYDEEKDFHLKFPLQREIELIAKVRLGQKDVFIIDDLWIYDESEFQSGYLPEYITPPKDRSIDFIIENFGNTHHIIRCYDHEGYIILIPKEFDPKVYFTDQQFLRRNLPFLFSKNESQHRLQKD
ncbi:MAG: hypothetical protein KDD50_01630 [Bdellovibrionales bacterium]|nr:hypothetical protein [Bdellovibrionales bacterium]